MAIKQKYHLVLIPSIKKIEVGELIIASYDEKSIIDGLDYKGKLAYGIVKYVPTIKQTKQYLYVLSDEKIREGDFVLTNKNIVARVIKVTNNGIGIEIKVLRLDNNLEYYPLNCKKIIASNSDIQFLIDKSPYNMEVHGVPNIPQEFVQTYVEERNKGNTITEVMVVCEIFGDTLKPKVNSKNEVTLSMVEDNLRIDGMVNQLSKMQMELFKITISAENHNEVTDLIDKLKERITNLKLSY